MQQAQAQHGHPRQNEPQPEERDACALSLKKKFDGEWCTYSVYGRTLPVLLTLVVYMLCLQFQPSEPYLVPYLTRVKLFSNKQVTYGMGAAADLVFSSYIFLLVPEKDYQTMTSYTQASSLVSYMLAAELGQGLVDYGASLVILLEITILSVALGSVTSFFLPSEVSKDQEWGLLTDEAGPLQNQGILEKIQETWRSRNLRLLSFWWVFGTAGFAMIPNYGTSLFDDIDAVANTNGHVLAASQGAACVGALAAAHVADVAAQVGGLVFIGGSFVVGLLCIIMAWSHTLVVTCPLYVAAVGINQLLLCLVYVQAAKSLSNQQFILLFGLNAVAGLLVQSGIQGVVVLLHLSITRQFYAFGGYCIAVGVVFWIFCFRHYRKTGTIRLVSREEERQALL